MARKGKWVEGFTADADLVEVAQAALRGRLDQFQDYLARVPHDSEHRVDNVHQLRVASRRVGAALELFREYLPPQRLLELSKQVARARKAAGHARDLDILSQRIEKLAESGPPDAWRILLKATHERRAAAMFPVLNACRKLKKQKFGRASKRLIGKVRLRRRVDRLTPPSYAQGAHRGLALLVVDFEAAAQADLHAVEALHAFRIQGKQLRYGLELFAAALDPIVKEEIYPHIVELQERLGVLNDQATAETIVRKWIGKRREEDLSAGMQLLKQDIARQLDQSHRDFLAWWTPMQKEEILAPLRRLIGLREQEAAQLDPSNESLAS